MALELAVERAALSAGIPAAECSAASAGCFLASIGPVVKSQAVTLK